MDTLLKNSALFWFLAGIILMLLEMILPGFVIFFFGVGAIITAILTWTKVIQTTDTQFIVFIVSSLATLLILRRNVKRYFAGGVTQSKDKGNISKEIIGERVIVTEDINPEKLSGKVELHGTMWNASADSMISKGETVEIIGSKDLTLHVKKV
jgi:membrane protein implicated in regulation of membrane protease activity